MSDESETAIYARDSVSAQVLESLTSLLPDAWRVQEETTNGDAAGDTRTDMVLTIEAGNGFGRLAVEIKKSMAPREVAQIVDRLRLTRRLDIRVEYLVAAPWLSASTRAQLTAGGINYLDLTGNVNIRLQQPALYIRTDGAANDPSPRPASVLTLKGPQAGRLVRALVDFVPPYTASMIAVAAGISVSYASRQLTELDREALVERDRRGGIVARDWTGLLRAARGTTRYCRLTARTPTSLQPAHGTFTNNCQVRCPESERSPDRSRRAKSHLSPLPVS